MCAKSILIVISQISASRHHLHTVSIVQLLILSFLVEKQQIKVGHTTMDHPVGHQCLASWV